MPTERAAVGGALALDAAEQGGVERVALGAVAALARAAVPRFVPGGLAGHGGGGGGQGFRAASVHARPEPMPCASAKLPWLMARAR